MHVLKLFNHSILNSILRLTFALYQCWEGAHLINRYIAGAAQVCASDMCIANPQICFPKAVLDDFRIAAD